MSNHTTDKRPMPREDILTSTGSSTGLPTADTADQRSLICTIGAQRTSNATAFQAAIGDTKIVPDWARGTALEGPHTPDTFSCNVFRANPPTPDIQPPDIVFTRQFKNHTVTTPTGAIVPMWVFADETGVPTYPSKPIRIKEGQMMHSTVKAATGNHTIHHHGLEPLPFNDGVGHASFETGQYTYQIKAMQAGTFFYHCHRNTVLHFEMGLFGGLIVDPITGPGKAFRDGYDGNGKLVSTAYDIERFWAIDEIDPVWHNLAGGHAAGMCGGDAGLHDFNPTAFAISGVFNNKTALDQTTVGVNAKVGQKVLIRNLCAGYTVQQLTFPFDVEIIGVDGRPMASRYGVNIKLPANTPWRQTSAQRSDVYFTAMPKATYPTGVKPPVPGKYTVKVEHLHWTSLKLLGTQLVTINIA